MSHGITGLKENLTVFNFVMTSLKLEIKPKISIVHLDERTNLRVRFEKLT